MSQQKLVKELSSQLQLLKSIRASEFGLQPPAIVVAMIFVQRGFRHIQQTIDGAAKNPWNSFHFDGITVLDGEMDDAQAWFAKAKERMGTRIKNTYTSFVLQVEEHLSDVEYSVFEGEQVKPLIDDIVKELDRIIVV